MAKQFSTTESKAVDKIVYQVMQGEILKPESQRPIKHDGAKAIDMLDALWRGNCLGNILLGEAQWSSQITFLVYKDRTTGVRKQKREDKAGDTQKYRVLTCLDGQHRLSMLAMIVYGLTIRDGDGEFWSGKVAFNPFTEQFRWAEDVALKNDPHWLKDIAPLMQAGIDNQEDVVEALTEEFKAQLKEARRVHGEELSSEEGTKISLRLMELAHLLTNRTVSVKTLQFGCTLQQMQEATELANRGGTNYKQSDLLWMVATSSYPTVLEACQGLMKGWEDFAGVWMPSRNVVLTTAAQVAFLRASGVEAADKLKGYSHERKAHHPDWAKENAAALQSVLTTMRSAVFQRAFIDSLQRAGIVSIKQMPKQKGVGAFLYLLFTLAKHRYQMADAAIAPLLSLAYFAQGLNGSSNVMSSALLQELRKSDSAETFIQWCQTHIVGLFTEPLWSSTLPAMLKADEKKDLIKDLQLQEQVLHGTRCLYVPEITVAEAIRKHHKDKQGAQRHHIHAKATFEGVNGTSANKNHTQNLAITTATMNKALKGSSIASQVEILRRKFNVTELDEMFAEHGLPPKFYSLAADDMIKLRIPMQVELLKGAMTRQITLWRETPKFDVPEPELKAA